MPILTYGEAKAKCTMKLLHFVNKGKIADIWISLLELGTALENALSETNSFLKVTLSLQQNLFQI